MNPPTDPRPAAHADQSHPKTLHDLAKALVRVLPRAEEPRFVTFGTHDEGDGTYLSPANFEVLRADGTPVSCGEPADEFWDWLNEAGVPLLEECSPTPQPLTQVKVDLTTGYVELDHLDRSSLDRLLLAANPTMVDILGAAVACDVTQIEAGSFEVCSGTVGAARGGMTWDDASSEIHPGRIADDAEMGAWKVTHIDAVTGTGHTWRLGTIAVATGADPTALSWEPLGRHVAATRGEIFYLGDGDVSYSLGDGGAAVAEAYGSLAETIDHDVLLRLDPRVRQGRRKSAPYPAVAAAAVLPRLPRATSAGRDRLWLGRTLNGRAAGITIDRIQLLESVRYLPTVSSAWDPAHAGAGRWHESTPSGATTRLETADLARIFDGTGDHAIFRVGDFHAADDLVLTDLPRQCSDRGEPWSGRLGVSAGADSVAQVFWAETADFEAYLIRLAAGQPSCWRESELMVDDFPGRTSWFVLTGKQLLARSRADDALWLALAQPMENARSHFARFEGTNVGVGIRLPEGHGGHWYVGLDAGGEPVAIVAVNHRDVGVYPLRPASEDDGLLRLLDERHAEFASNLPGPNGFETALADFRNMVEANDGVISEEARGYLHWLVNDFLEVDPSAD